MANTFTINLAQQATSVKILDDYDVSTPLMNRDSMDDGRRMMDEMQDLKKQKAELSHLCQMLNRILGEFNQFYNDVSAKHKEEIARLSVEIANKILMQKIQKGDYQIESIVKEALRNAPTRQDVVVHLNPEDLPQCQKLQQDDPTSALAGIKFVADPSIGRAECLIETSKGIIKSFVDEHMERISEALAKVE